MTSTGELSHDDNRTARSIDDDLSAGTVFQAETIETLRHQLGDRHELLRGIVGLYLEQSRDLLAQIEAEHASVDVTRLRALTHKLRGSTATMGGDRLAAVCHRGHRIEHCPPTPADLTNATQEIRREFEMLADGLDRYLLRLSSSNFVD